MTTTRALAVAAYVAAVATPAAADWRSVADMLHAALPAVRGAVKPADAPAGAVPRWYADWKLGKVYSLDSLAVTFADGVAVRVNLAKAPGKLPRIAHACRVAIAFYRARTPWDGDSSVPAFASLVTVSDGATFDAEACSALTVDLRRTAYVAPVVRPAVTAEAVERMERELERRRAGLAVALSDLDAMRERPVSAFCNAETKAARIEGAESRAAMWQAAVSGAESELSTMRAAVTDAPPPVLSPLAVAAIEAMREPEAAPCDPVAVMPDLAALPVTVAACEPCEAVNDAGPVAPPPAGPAGAAVAPLAVDAAHLEPMAICPAVGLPCKVDCGFRPGCGAPVEIATIEAPVEMDFNAAAEAVEAEPLAALCSDDDAPTLPGPVTVLCLSHKAREAVLSRTVGRAVPDYSHGAKGGAFRLSLDDAAACAGIRSVRFVGLPRKPYTRAAAPISTPVVGIQGATPLAAILANVAPVSWVHPIIAGLARPPVVLHAASKL